jgi:hypothetical protein
MTQREACESAQASARGRRAQVAKVAAAGTGGAACRDESVPARPQASSIGQSPGVLRGSKASKQGEGLAGPASGPAAAGSLTRLPVRHQPVLAGLEDSAVLELGARADVDARHLPQALDRRGRLGCGGGRGARDRGWGVGGAWAARRVPPRRQSQLSTNARALSWQ